MIDSRAARTRMLTELVSSSCWQWSLWKSVGWSLSLLHRWCVCVWTHLLDMLEQHTSDTTSRARQQRRHHNTHHIISPTATAYTSTSNRRRRSQDPRWGGRWTYRPI